MSSARTGAWRTRTLAEIVPAECLILAELVVEIGQPLLESRIGSQLETALFSCILGWRWHE